MRIRRLVLRANPLCVMCQAAGRITLATEVDHVVPLFKGGTESLDPFENRQGLCSQCHQDKTNDDLKRVPPVSVEGFPPSWK